MEQSLKMDQTMKARLHLYLGCSIFVFPADALEDGFLEQYLIDYPDAKWHYELTLDNIQKVRQDGYLPMLRRVNDFTVEDFREWALIFDQEVEFEGHEQELNENMDTLREHGVEAFDYEDEDNSVVYRHTAWLLSKHFDLFGDIDAGRAIDRSKAMAIAVKARQNRKV